jgi:hypothetical protein
MITDSCESCGWSQTAMVARVFTEMPPSIPIAVTVRSEGLEFGPQAEYRSNELVELLEPLGFRR